jgi:molybdate transport system substrate-binding protein
MRRTSWLACLLFCLCGGAASAAERPLTVFAAASLQESLDAVGKAWEAQGGRHVVVSYAASSVLARQIEQGAQADVFISADNDWMDYLQDRKRIEPASRFVLVRNTLVLVAPVTSNVKAVDLNALSSVLAALGPGRLAVAETASVPAGRYAKQSLEKLKLWLPLSTHLAQGDNVRAALEYVARGEASLGIVYVTDARAEARVRIVAMFPDKSHAPIVYPAARTTTADAKVAADFLAFLRTPQAVTIFRHAGFADGR